MPDEPFNEKDNAKPKPSKDLEWSNVAETNQKHMASLRAQVDDAINNIYLQASRVSTAASAMGALAGGSMAGIPHQWLVNNIYDALGQHGRLMSAIYKDDAPAVVGGGL